MTHWSIGPLTKAEGNEQEVCCYIADDDANGIDVSVLLEQVIKIFQLRERLWYAEHGTIGSIGRQWLANKVVRQVTRSLLFERWEGEPERTAQDESADDEESSHLHTSVQENLARGDIQIRRHRHRRGSIVGVSPISRQTISSRRR